MTTMLHARSRADAPSHRFTLGQTVRMKSRAGLSMRAAETFRVTATLPSRDGSAQYRIRADEETHERVAAEDNLEEVEAQAG